MMKNVSTALFCVALICFALPWHGVAVGDAKLGGVTGIHLVTGKSVSERGLFGIEVKRKVDIEPFAALAFLAALGGAAAGFARGRRGLASSAAAGALAVVFLLLLWRRLGGDGGGFAEPEMRVGFHLALLLSAGAAGVALYAMATPGGAAGGADEPGTRDAAKTCSCGAEIPGGSRFCGKCGKPVGPG